MAGFQEHQANHFPGDVFPPLIPPQAHNYPLQDDRVSLEHPDILSSQLRVY
jgi:hypothetical protein